MKTAVKIFSVFSAILAANLFLAAPVLAVNKLVIQFESEPLFSDINFLPGQEIFRWVKVTNNTDEVKYIAAEAIDSSGNDLSAVLNLEIKEKGGLVLFSGALLDFYNSGETFLSSVSPGSVSEYVFRISFPEDTGNAWQGKTTSFDILVGPQGQQSEGESRGGGGGGGLPPGLIITNEAATSVTENAVTISWDTNYKATGRVVYSKMPSQFILSAGEPGYGYDSYTAENTEKMIHHTVVLTGLEPGAEYFFRCISHGSFAVSYEHSFKTLVSPVTNNEEGRESEVKGAYTEIINQRPENISFGQKEKNSYPSDKEDKNSFQEEIGNEDNFLPYSLKASIKETISRFKYTCFLLVLLEIIFIILFFYAIKKGKIEKNRIWWMLPFAVILLFIAYYIYCPFAKIIIFFIILISLIAYIAVMKKA